jgi:hypothetical protein
LLLLLITARALAPVFFSRTVVVCSPAAIPTSVTAETKLIFIYDTVAAIALTHPIWHNLLSFLDGLAIFIGTRTMTLLATFCVLAVSLIL